jgi:hypothetical protein
MNIIISKSSWSIIKMGNTFATIAIYLLFFVQIGF